MKVALAIILTMYYISQSSGYFFPICSSKDDKSCTNYFTLPSFSFPSLSFGGGEQESVFHNVEDPTVKTTGFIFENFDNIVTVVGAFYEENVEAFAAPIYQTIVVYVSPIKEQYIRFLRYVPFLKYEEKVKADSRLYLLFIGTSVGIYILLYVYFTRKLCFYYQQRLREQYINNVKRIFRGKEE
ncbi:hypothetical protein Zmor_009939 [Zophobas morio]|uniref:Uncharacterized protein n=1 Tax=Zophobas morio TaxID=2755281 RepID=A0AA38IPT3_9CUCU|nr:hypothetical protein Zmor_009939 [Zophobas morio]